MMSEYKPRPKCCICGRIILPGEARMWTYNKSTYFHEECYRREVRADDERYADTQEDNGHDRLSEEDAEYPF